MKERLWGEIKNSVRTQNEISYSSNTEFVPQFVVEGYYCPNNNDGWNINELLYDVAEIKLLLWEKAFVEGTRKGGSKGGRKRERNLLRVYYGIFGSHPSSFSTIVELSKCFLIPFQVKKWVFHSSTALSLAILSIRKSFFEL